MGRPRSGSRGTAKPNGAGRGGTPGAQMSRSPAVGRREAAALERALGGRPFAVVLSSPLSRAWETCRLAGYGDVAEKTDDLLEWNYGAVEGRTSADIRRERPGWTIWRDGVPFGETIESVAARAGKVIDRAVAAGGDVLLFAHGHVLRILTARWLGPSRATAGSSCSRRPPWACSARRTDRASSGRGTSRASP